MGHVIQEPGPWQQRVIGPTVWFCVPISGVILHLPSRLLSKYGRICRPDSTVCSSPFFTPDAVSEVTRSSPSSARAEVERQGGVKTDTASLFRYDLQESTRCSYGGFGIRALHTEN